MKVIDKGPGDHTVIMAVREGLVQPFDAGTWLDLRVGFLLSLCGNADPGEDDTITGLGLEDLTSPVSPLTDQFWIGVRNNGTLFPGSGGVVYVGWTNIDIHPLRISELASSDAGSGTTNTDYWRPGNNASGILRGSNCIISDGAAQQASVESMVHFVQNYSGGHAAGYATLLLLQLKRPSVSLGAPVTVNIKSGVTSADVLFTSTPTKALLQTNMESFPGSVQQLGPVSLSAVPDSFFLYWPFHQSRLRIHCMGIEVIAS